METKTTFRPWASKQLVEIGNGLRSAVARLIELGQMIDQHVDDDEHDAMAETWRMVRDEIVEANRLVVGLHVGLAKTREVVVKPKPETPPETEPPERRTTDGPSAEPSAGAA